MQRILFNSPFLDFVFQRLTVVISKFANKRISNSLLLLASFSIKHLIVRWWNDDFFFNLFASHNHTFNSFKLFGKKIYYCKYQKMHYSNDNGKKISQYFQGSLNYFRKLIMAKKFSQFSGATNDFFYISLTNIL